MKPKAVIRVLETPADLFRAAAAEFAQLATTAIQDRGRFAVALSGGSTPKSLYQLLASGAIPGIAWDRVCFFWGDERHVPPDDPESNYRMAKEALLSRVPAPTGNIFRIHGEEQSAASAAEAYESDLKKFFHLGPGEFPHFDLVLLGMGPDGHMASLFPGSAGLEEKKRLVVANWVEKFKTDRITLTLPVLNHARSVIFLVSGAGKTEALQAVFSDTEEGPPAKMVSPENGRLLWLLDRAAATDLPAQARAG